MLQLRRSVRNRRDSFIIVVRSGAGKGEVAMLDSVSPIA
jgi:hypothetical protein